MAVSKGVILDEHALVSTVPVNTDTVQKHVFGLAQQEITALFTSQFALLTLMNLLKDRFPDTWSFYCTEHSTRQLLEKCIGDIQKIKGTASSAGALARLLCRNPRITQPIVFFCGDQRREELPRILNDSGVFLQELVLYHTRLQPYVFTKSYQGILFCSPSAVKSFFLVNNAPRETIFFAIGPSTANELNRFAPNQVVTSHEPDKNSLLRLALSYFT